MEKEVICSGDKGMGTYCSKCESLKCGYFKIDLTSPCMNCGSTEFTICSPIDIMIIKTMKEKNNGF